MNAPKIHAPAPKRNLKVKRRYLPDAGWPGIGNIRPRVRVQGQGVIIAASGGYAPAAFLPSIALTVCRSWSLLIGFSMNSSTGSQASSRSLLENVPA